MCSREGADMNHLDVQSTAALGPKACGVLSFQRPSGIGSQPGSDSSQVSSSYPARVFPSHRVSAEVFYEVSRFFFNQVSGSCSSLFFRDFSRRGFSYGSESFSAEPSASCSSSFSSSCSDRGFYGLCDQVSILCASDSRSRGLSGGRLCGGGRRNASRVPYHLRHEGGL